jgi:hypothetical protein
MQKLDSEDESVGVRSKSVASNGSISPDDINAGGSVQFEDDEETRQTRLDAEILHKEYYDTDLTYEECIRFRSLRTLKKARKKLKFYLEWQETYRIDQIPVQTLAFKNDKEVWEYAVSHSLDCFPGVKLKKGTLPRVARIIGRNPNYNSPNDTDDASDSKCGKRILYILSGLIDQNLAPLDLYALSFAVYFYLKLDRFGLEDVITVTDARSGRGWNNPSAASLLPFAKLIAKHMDFFPQRLEKFHAYPVPLPAKILWGVLKNFIKPVVVAKVNIHWGDTAVDALPPNCMGEKYFDKATMERLEKERSSEFC